LAKKKKYNKTVIEMLRIFPFTGNGDRDAKNPSPLQDSASLRQNPVSASKKKGKDLSHITNTSVLIAFRELNVRI